MDHTGQGKCGGQHCQNFGFPDDCCNSYILASGKYCETSGVTAPCIIGSGEVNFSGALHMKQYIGRIQHTYLLSFVAHLQYLNRGSLLSSCSEQTDGKQNGELRVLGREHIVECCIYIYMYTAACLGRTGNFVLCTHRVRVFDAQSKIMSVVTHYNFQISMGRIFLDCFWCTSHGVLAA